MTVFGVQGTEWVIEAHNCDAARLADVEAVGALVDDVIASLGLTPAAPALGHRFPEPGGVTALVLLTESHLTVHTFPEHGSLCLNLFCCVPRHAWAWRDGLSKHVGAHAVTVRRLERAFGRGGAGAVAPALMTPAIGNPAVRPAPTARG